MPSRIARIEQVIQVLDGFPIERYPAPLRSELHADLEALKKEVAIKVEALLVRESGEIVGDIQTLLGNLRIQIDRLLELIE